MKLGMWEWDWPGREKKQNKLTSSTNEVVRRLSSHLGAIPVALFARFFDMIPTIKTTLYFNICNKIPANK